MLSVYALTLFLSAALLFFVQPMVAKMVLPLLGGTPAVWNTCMLFFQALLLLGYLYAHVSTRLLGVRRQALFHILLLFLPLLALPIVLPVHSVPPATGNPVPWLLATLLLSAGLPFFAVATSAPLLQKWFASTDHPAAKDPYFLYGASNLGSMTALLCYPLVFEPQLRLYQQSLLWAAGFAALIALCGACAFLLFSNRVRRPAEEADAASADAEADVAPGWERRLRWVALALVPSSLMLSVTSYTSTDIASFPLLWVVPLALYLLTFILAFGKTPDWLHREMARALPLVVLTLTLFLIFQYLPKLSIIIPLNLLTFFLAAMVCHGELYRDRPRTRHLTEFYIWMSVGGTLGGLLNTAAPFLFKHVFEFPLALVLTCLLSPRRKELLNVRALSFVLGMLGTMALGYAAIVFGHPKGDQILDWMEAHADTDLLRLTMVYGLPLLLLYTFFRGTRWFGLGIGAALLVSFLDADARDRVLLRDRSFFGVLTVRLTDGCHKLRHGTTLHGMQCMNHKDLREQDQPLTYYHRGGPVGGIFAALNEPKTGSKIDRPEARRLAFVGLGTGTLAAYGQPGQHITYYELDPAVLRIAANPRLFTYLRDSKADVQVVLGDARVRLREAPERGYDLLLVDAFSSDAIPVHLLTREALALYLAKLADGGLLVFHITNRYFALAPVLGALARDAGLTAVHRTDKSDDEANKFYTHYVVLARRPEDLAALLKDRRWEPLAAAPAAPLWKDDFSDLLRVAEWSWARGPQGK